MPKPELKLVVSNGDFERISSPPKPSPRLLKVADNGPKLRIQVGLRIIPRNPLDGPIDVYARKLLDALPPKLCAQVAYGASANLPVVEPLDHGYSFTPFVPYSFWLYIRESEAQGPWRSARALNQHLRDLQEKYTALLFAVQEYAGAKFAYKLLATHTEKLPDWLDDLRTRRMDIMLTILPNWWDFK